MIVSKHLQMKKISAFKQIIKPDMNNHDLNETLRNKILALNNP